MDLNFMSYHVRTTPDCVAAFLPRPGSFEFSYKKKITGIIKKLTDWDGQVHTGPRGK